MARWDAQRVAALAPDAGSLAAARKLAHPGPWSQTGCSEVLVWGRCQGSGATPYQASVDLTGPAFRCTCPSRKFPCKHALALLLLWSDGTVGEGGIDEAAAEWARGRAERTAPARNPAAAPDPAGQAKRLADRIELMDGGIEDTARWLGDLVRAGLAEARTRDVEFWDTAARRMIDAQVPGLATRLRRFPALLARADWGTAALDELGLLWSLVCTWRRRSELLPDDVAELRAALGWSTPTAEVRAADERSDDWAVLGIITTQDGRLTEQRTWLRSVGGETVLVLDFAAGGSPLPVPHLVGQVLRGALSRYPGAAPRRATLHDGLMDAGRVARLEHAGSVDAAFDAAAAHLAANPWAARTPVALAARVVAADGDPRLADDEGGTVPFVSDHDPWPLAALTGGRTAEVFGELEAGAFRPLSIVADDRLVAL